jgi:tetratricopeptide (TPR) repeat protein
MPPLRRLLRYALAALLLAGAASHGLAQSVPAPATILDDPEVQRLGEEGLNLVYDMRFDEARARFDALERRYPEHPLPPFLKALEAWWLILVDFRSEEHDDDFFDAMKEVERRADRLLRGDDEHFDANFFKAAALGFRGRLRSNRGQWFRASRDGYASLDHVFFVGDYAEHDADFGFGEGVYDYFAWAVPRRYPVVKPFMGLFPRGDRDRGLEALERTAAEGTFIRTEAAYFLHQVYTIYEPDYDAALRIITELRERHPANPLFHVLEGRTYARWGRWDEAREAFEGVLQRYRARAPGYSDGIAEQAFYFLGRERMARRDYQQALSYLGQLAVLVERFDDDSFFKTMGRLRQGMSHDALGQRQAAVGHYRTVLTLEDYSRAHDRAERYLNRPFGQ